MMLMETLFIIAVVIAIIVIVVLKDKKPTPKKSEERKPEYAYTRRVHAMTRTEQEFFERLMRVIDQRYYIIPQAHVSMFVDHRVKGQNWRAAFSRINGKSVDFLIVERANMSPVVAIELDDATHDRADRVERDIMVDDLLRSINMPLVRYRAGEWTTEADIAEKLRNTLAL